MARKRSGKVPVLYFRISQSGERKSAHDHLIKPNEAAPESLVKAVMEVHARFAQSVFEIPDEFCYILPLNADVEYTVAFQFSRVPGSDSRTLLHTLAAATEVENLRQEDIDPVQFAASIEWDQYREWTAFKQTELKAWSGGPDYAPWVDDILRHKNGRAGGEEWDKLTFDVKCIMLSMALRYQPARQWYAAAYACNAPERAKLTPPASLSIWRNVRPGSYRPVLPRVYGNIDDLVPEIWTGRAATMHKVWLAGDITELRRIERRCSSAQTGLRDLEYARNLYAEQTTDTVGAMRAWGCSEPADKLHAIALQRIQHYDGRIAEIRAEEKEKFRDALWVIVAIGLFLALVVGGIQVYNRFYSSDSDSQVPSSRTLHVACARDQLAYRVGLPARPVTFADLRLADPDKTREDHAS